MPKPETFYRDKTFHHVLIASCSTEPLATELLQDFFVSVLDQVRKPSHLVLLATTGGDMCDFMLQAIRTRLAPAGIIVELFLMDQTTGDLGALARAVDYLEDEFAKNQSRPFDEAWVTYFSFPSYLHRRYCQHVYKQVFLARWSKDPDMQVLILDPKARDSEDQFGKVHETVMRGRCLRLFIGTRLFRCLVKQQNVYWTGILVTFVRSPICLDDNAGVVKFGAWCDPKSPILLPSKDEEVNFEGQLGVIKEVLPDDDPSKPTKCVVWLHVKEKEVTLFPDEFETCFRSTTTMNKARQQARIDKFMRRLPDLLLDEDAVRLTMVRVETAVEAGLAIGCLVEQQDAVMQGIRRHLRRRLGDNPLRSDFEKNLLIKLANEKGKGRLHEELGFPPAIPFETALVTEPRHASEIELLAKQAPLVGPIHLCMLLGIEPVPQADVLDDGVELEAVGAKFMSMASSDDMSELKLHELVEHIMIDGKLPLEIFHHVGMYSKVYCLSKGIRF